jgi:hypothetical protein
MFASVNNDTTMIALEIPMRSPTRLLRGGERAACERKTWSKIFVIHPCVNLAFKGPSQRNSTRPTIKGVAENQKSERSGCHASG